MLKFCLKPVFNYYKAVSYMYAYFSKSESGTSQTLLQACIEIRSMNLPAREAMHKLASSYLSLRQFPLQEAVYCSLPELWLRNRFPRTVFGNTSILPERIRICKSVEETEELNPDSTDIFKQIMVERYTDRPNSQYNNGMYGIVDHICFAPHYNLDYENKYKNDSQPDVLGKETKETPQGISETLPKPLPLISSSEKLKLRTSRQVLRYYVPNKQIYPEKFTHYWLSMFYPFRDENALEVSNSYFQKLYEEGVLHIINGNKRLFDPNCEEINSAFVRLSQVRDEISDVDFSVDYDDDYLTEKNKGPPLSEGVGTSRCVNIFNVIISDDPMREIIKSLNSQQKQIFDEVYN